MMCLPSGFQVVLGPAAAGGHRFIIGPAGVADKERDSTAHGVGAKEE